tara:strand:+ start:1333 stop:1644 length:312 start_codon:yes stop_codon:yes gene_type:complete
MKKILVKNNLVVDVSDAEFEVHENVGTWQDCSNDDVQKDWTVNADGSVEPFVVVDKTYSDKRKKEYPSYGNVIDALFKKEAGDSTEWDTLATDRQAVKDKYPK